MQNERKPTTPELLHVVPELFRTLARPAITIIFATVLAEGAISGTDFPDWFLALAIPAITWWFTERTVTHISERKGDYDEKKT